MNNQQGQVNWVDVLRPYGVVKDILLGEPIHYQGEKSSVIGLVITGTAKASVYSKHGQETWVGTFAKGDFFGYAELLTDTPIDFEIIADTNLQVLMVPAENFINLLSANRELASYVNNGMAVRLKRLTTHLVEAVTLSSPGRICAEILRLSKPVGVDPAKLIVRPNPVFIDLALRLNTTRETVSRTVNALQKKGVLTRKSGALLIEKPDTLRAKIK